MRWRHLHWMAAAVVLASGGYVAAQRAGTAEPAIAAMAAIDGRQYEYAGAGECQHAGDASIYGAAAASWHASFASSSETVGWSRTSMTIWQLRSGEIQITLSMLAGATTYEIATVTGGPMRGAGAGQVERRGTGGTLTINGTTAAGRRIQVTVRCSRFTAPEDNG